MTYNAKVVCDSISPCGVRLTTLEVVMPRIVLAEFNTHRTFCLAGDVELEFDLPAGSTNSKHHVYHMRIDEFVDKWLNGARRYAANPKREYDLSWILPNGVYAAPYAAAMMGMANASNIHRLCREGEIDAYQNGRTWMITGDALKRWRQSVPAHTRFDMRARLAGMRIRQLNEFTGDIQWSHVIDACVSGVKEVYEVTAGDFTVAGSLDHRVLTTDGWKTIGTLKRGDLLIVRKFGKRDEDKLDPMRLKKIDGVWRAQWQRDERERLLAENRLCRRCGENEGVEIHHIEPVYRNPARAFDQTNITLLCDSCHNTMHETQDWQGGTYLYGSAASVEDIRFRGVEPTYDLSIAGDFPNFLANGVVVHNSRNSASSRAIPIEKRIQQVKDNPFIPDAFAANKKGMEAGEVLDEESQRNARLAWIDAMHSSIAYAEALANAGVHKQWANRLLEPFSWHTVVVTATEWDNYFALRISKHAQPEIRRVSELMKAAMDESKPKQLNYWEWHLPYVQQDELLDFETRLSLNEDIHGHTGRLRMLSSARCARVSYLTHDGKRDHNADFSLHDRLRVNKHMSPFEHPAQCVPAGALDCLSKHGTLDFGNFRKPWLQYRKMIPGEAVATGDE